MLEGLQGKVVRELVTYTATITTGAKDLAGNALETDYTWSFTTESETPIDGEPPSDGDGGGGGRCFIVTASYGSPMEPHVMVLCDFRDRFLLTNIAGKAFVETYYTYSPAVADFTARHDNLRAIVHVGLLPLVGMSWIALNLGPEYYVILMLLLGSGFFGFVCFRRKSKKI